MGVLIVGSQGIRNTSAQKKEEGCIPFSREMAWWEKFGGVGREKAPALRSLGDILTNSSSRNKGKEVE